MGDEAKAIIVITLALCALFITAMGLDTYRDIHKLKCIQIVEEKTN